MFAEINSENQRIQSHNISSSKILKEQSFSNNKLYISR